MSSTTNNTVISKQTIQRLLRDVKDIIQHPLTSNGIYYIHDEEDMLKGYAMIMGPEGTPYFGGYLLENWLGCLRELALEKRHLIQLAKNSFEGSFLPEKEKAKWIEKIERVAASTA
jgi:hypothetical protein